MSKELFSWRDLRTKRTIIDIDLTRCILSTIGTRGIKASSTKPINMCTISSRAAGGGTTYVRSVIASAMAAKQN